VLTPAVALTLLALLAWDLGLAGRLVSEDGVVEWVQVVLLIAAAGLSGRRAISLIADGQPAAPDVLLTFLFVGLVIGEVDLDRRLFGMRVIHTRFFTKPAVWWPYKLLAAIVVGGVPLAVAAYTWRHRWQVWRSVLRLPVEPWGHLLVPGAAIIGFTQLFEHGLNSLLPLPPYFLEESLELVAALYLFLGTIEFTRFTPGYPASRQ
jgi:hypothetical protein